MTSHFSSLNARELARRSPATAATFCVTPRGWPWAAHCCARARWREPLAPRKKRKVVVITFGGGARDQETFAPEGQENIPHLMRELIPQSAFFTQVVNRGILGHYVATASLVTGVYETFNNFAAVPPEHPTVFEYFRKDLRRPSLGCVGCGSQQWFQPDWREQPSFVWRRIGCDRDSAEASVDGGHVGSEQRRSTTCCGTTTRRRSTRPNSEAASLNCSSWKCC